MKQTLSAILIGLMACGSAFGLATQKTNSVNLVLADVCDGTFNDFKFQLSGYDDQVFSFNYDQSLTGVAASFRITKPIDGTIYLDVPVTSVTVSGTNATFSIARSNIPPPGSYYGELLSYESVSTNYYRSIAQGKLPVTWSLYLNESNFFARVTNGAAVGQVYMQGSGWIDPPWLGTNSGLGSIYATLGMHASLSNWTDTINTKATNNLANITTLQGYTNAAQTAYGWGNHSTNGYITNTTETLWPAASNTVTVNAANGATAYTWGDHALAGYLTATQNIYAGMTIADRSKLGTNIAGLTQGTYTGSLTSVSYTGTTALVAGRPYAWGFNKANAFGTSTLSIATFLLTRTAAGAASNYFTFAGTDSNLVLKLDGDGSSKSDVSGVYVRQITNGTLSAVDVDVGNSITLGGTTRTTWPAGSSTNLSDYNNNAGFATTNDFPGTWQSHAPSYFYLNSNPSGFIPSNTTLLGYGITDGYTKAQSDSAYATTGTVGAIQVQTGTWNQAATDASAGTNFISTNTLQSQINGKVGTNDESYLSILQSMTNWLPVASSSNYLIYNPATRALSGCVTNQGTGAGTITNLLSTDGSVQIANPGGPQPNLSTTNAVAGWSGYNTTQQVTYAASVSTNLSLTGTGVIPDVTGSNYVQISDNNGSPRWYSTNGYYVTFGGGWYYIMTNATPGPGGPQWHSSSTNVIGTYTPFGDPLDSTGDISVAYSVVVHSALWKHGRNASNQWQITRDGVVLVDATNVATKIENSATSNAIPTTAAQVGAVATNGNAANLTNFPASVVLTNTTSYTQAVAQAASSLSTNGGTMGGTITMKTNAITIGTNSMSLYGGVLSGTNGVYFYNPVTGSNYWILCP